MRGWLFAKAASSLVLLHVILPAALAQITAPDPIDFIDFEDLPANGPGTPALVVSNQYASRGVVFNGPVVIDYSIGILAIPGFAHSGSKALEQCFAKEFCTTPFDITFSRPHQRVKLWVGFSQRLTETRSVVMTAFAATGIRTAVTTLSPSTGPQPVRLPLEIVQPAPILRVSPSVRVNQLCHELPRHR